MLINALIAGSSLELLCLPQPWFSGKCAAVLERQLHYWKYPPEDKPIPQKWHFEDDFPFPKVGYVNSLEGTPFFFHFSLKHDYGRKGSFIFWQVLCFWRAASISTNTGSSACAPFYQSLFAWTPPQKRSGFALGIFFYYIPFFGAELGRNWHGIFLQLTLWRYRHFVEEKGKSGCVGEKRASWHGLFCGRSREIPSRFFTSMVRLWKLEIGDLKMEDLQEDSELGKARSFRNVHVVNI